MAQVQYQNVSKYYGDVTALHDFSLTIGNQEFVTLVGPSGCGKTTTLNVTAGLDEPSAGQIFIDRELMNDVPPSERNISMVFQSYALYPHKTVRDNIGFGLKVRRKARSEIERRVREAAELLEIDHLLDRKPRELSGGQRQRVALGRAITRQPKLFLLDEPLSSLDAKLRLQMRAELRRLFKRVQGTVLYVTHDQAEAMTMSDRVVVMNEGLVQQIGTPVNIYDRPKNDFVANFFGSPAMNFVKCALVQNETDIVVQVDDHHWSIPLLSETEPIYARLMAHRSRLYGVVRLGIRPEDVTLEPLGQIDGQNYQHSYSLPCEVSLIEPMGPMNVVLVNVGKQQIRATTEPYLRFKLGEIARLCFDPAKIHFFDIKNGRNLTV